MPSDETIAAISQRFVPIDCPAVLIGQEILNIEAVPVNSYSSYLSVIDVYCKESDDNNPVCITCQLFQGLTIQIEENLN